MYHILASTVQKQLSLGERFGKSAWNRASKKKAAPWESTFQQCDIRAATAEGTRYSLHPTKLHIQTDTASWHHANIHTHTQTLKAAAKWDLAWLSSWQIWFSAVKNAQWQPLSNWCQPLQRRRLIFLIILMQIIITTTARFSERLFLGDLKMVLKLDGKGTQNIIVLLQQVSSKAAADNGCRRCLSHIGGAVQKITFPTLPPLSISERCWNWIRQSRHWWRLHHSCRVQQCEPLNYLIASTVIIFSNQILSSFFQYNNDDAGTVKMCECVSIATTLHWLPLFAGVDAGVELLWWTAEN